MMEEAKHLEVKNLPVIVEVPPNNNGYVLAQSESTVNLPHLILKGFYFFLS
jgi:hypothetical protein